MKKKTAENKYKKRLISLSPSVNETLNKRAKKLNKPVSTLISESILSDEAFSQDVEWFLQRSCAETGLTRKQMLERAVLELVRKERA